MRRAVAVVALALACSGCVIARPHAGHEEYRGGSYEEETTTTIDPPVFCQALGCPGSPPATDPSPESVGTE